MRAVVVESFGEPATVQEVPDPVVTPRGVVVRVDATGLCRSDWHAWRGHDDDVALPHVPGHELAGTVVAVGADVRRWREGARVTVPFVVACGRCAVCAAGDGQVVGLAAVMIGVAVGARVVAVDVSAGALGLARELGAEACVDAGAGDVPAAVVQATGGGAHVSTDAYGSEGTCADSVLALRRRGRQVQIGLLPPATGRPRVPMERVIGYELDVLGSHGMAAADYPALLGLVTSGALRPDRLVSRTIGLDDLPAALAALDGVPATAGITVAVP